MSMRRKDVLGLSKPANIMDKHEEISYQKVVSFAKPLHNSITYSALSRMWYSLFEGFLSTKLSSIIAFQ